MDNLGAKLHSTMDADFWAEEFCKLNNCSDKDMMRTWFANAIMVGYDHRSYKAGTMLRFCAGLISTMPQFENLHPDDVREWILNELDKLSEISNG